MKTSNKSLFSLMMLLCLSCGSNELKEQSIKNSNHANDKGNSDTKTFEEKLKANDNDSIPLMYSKKNTLAVIDEVKTYQNLSRPFHLDTDANVYIHAVGEGLKCQEVISSSESDNIEFYFDLLNEKRKIYDDNDRQYRFFWNWNKVEGKNMAMQGVKYNKCGSLKKQVIELQFPWQTLAFTPEENKGIGFDFTVTDKDGKELKKFSWFTGTDKNWESPNLFGTMKLATETSSHIDRNAVFTSTFTLTPPTIDCNHDAVWNTAMKYETTKVIVGEKKLPQNSRPVIKSLWDKNNLYFFVEVTDQQIERPECEYLIWDFAYIETLAGEVVWKMTPENTKHAGGALKNLLADTTIHLRKGDYLLKYVSDENHAYNNWDDDPPSEPFYGVVVWKE